MFLLHSRVLAPVFRILILIAMSVGSGVSDELGRLIFSLAAYSHLDYVFIHGKERAQDYSQVGESFLVENEYWGLDSDCFFASLL